MMPQCGLAPGFISIVANELAGRLDELDEIRMRVGALTEHPHQRPQIRIDLVGNTGSSTNTSPCATRSSTESRPRCADEGHETFTLEGTDYEAFNTSGGVERWARRLAGRNPVPQHKTIQYPGHCANHEAPDRRTRPRRTHAHGNSGQRAAPHVRGRCRHIRQRNRQEGRRAGGRDLHAQGLLPRRRGSTVERDPDHDRFGNSARRSIWSARNACRSGVSFVRKRSASTPSLPTASANTTPDPPPQAAWMPVGKRAKSAWVTVSISARQAG